MARIAIYLSAELKARMDAIKNINWSKVVKPAIEKAIKNAATNTDRV